MFRENTTMGPAEIENERCVRVSRSPSWLGVCELNHQVSVCLAVSVHPFHSDGRVGFTACFNSSVSRVSAQVRPMRVYLPTSISKKSKAREQLPKVHWNS